MYRWKGEKDDNQKREHSNRHFVSSKNVVGIDSGGSKNSNRYLK